MTKPRAAGDAARPGALSRATMRLEWLEIDLAICRIDAGAAVPGWALEAAFTSITRTDLELSIVTPMAALPSEGTPQRAALRVEGPWRAVRVAGQLPFNLTGVVAGLTQPLAAAGIPVFVLSTFDTDYVMVRSDRMQEADRALAGAGFGFVEAPRSGR